MKTGTGIAVSLAVVVALTFLFTGSSFLSLFQEEPTTVVESAPTSSMGNSNELVVADQTIGSGAVAEAGKKVTVEYVGHFIDGTVFDASAKHSPDGFSFNLGAGEVIAGWDQGVAGMKEGGIRILTIPSSLGYGPNDYGPIPGNSTLIFEVKLLKVQ